MVARSPYHDQEAPPRKPAPKGKQEAEFLLPLETVPMDAKSAERLGADAWQYEPKWDGFRCLAFKAGRAIDLRAKSGKPLGRYFPEVVTMLASLVAERFVLDGELVIEVDGRLDFDALQMRLHPAESRIRKLSADTPARLVIFDILAAPDGSVTINRPLQQRRRLLEAFMADQFDPWSSHFGGRGSQRVSSYLPPRPIWPLRKRGCVMQATAQPIPRSCPAARRTSSCCRSTPPTGRKCMT
jgi:ATP-dependent DNA ligase